MQKVRCVHCDAIEGHFSGCLVTDRYLKDRGTMCENSTRQKWEYAMIIIADTSGLMSAMDARGRQGWELVQVIDLGQIVDVGHYRMFWRRLLK